MVSHRWLAVLALGTLVAGCVGSPAAQERPSWDARADAAERGLGQVAVEHARLQAEVDEVERDAGAAAGDLRRIQEELAGIAEAAAELEARAQAPPAEEPAAEA